MPTYCYTNDENGKTIERQFAIKDDIPAEVRVGSRIFTRDLRAEHAGQRSGDAWTNHWSLSMGARTDEHAAEIARKCKRNKVDCRFDDHLLLKVNSPSHQRKLAAAIFGKGKVRNLDSYY